MSLSQVLGYQLTQANLESLANFEQAVGQPFELRPVEYTLLQLLREGLCTTPSQLAKELRITPPSMSVWLDKLTARGLLSRSKSTVDGRAQQLALTAKGQKLITQAHEKLLLSEQRMQSHLSAGERTLLLEILQKISQSGIKPS
ncbi:MAG: winged helix-turn-helix transcriptional regulator [Brachymonas sp.]|nr:winged helix-turn-helix transcriptional regulator [Brachymonas sp.]